MHLTSDVFAAPAFYEEALATCVHSSPPGRVSKLPPKITRGPSSIVQTLKTHLIVEGLPIQLLIEIRFRHVLELDMLKVVRCEDAHPHQLPLKVGSIGRGLSIATWDVITNAHLAEALQLLCNVHLATPEACVPEVLLIRARGQHIATQGYAQLSE